ncbi:unnamed protein product [Jaminaea pallidilutea]
MTVVDVVAALSEGSLPTNDQVVAALRRLQGSSVLSKVPEAKYSDQIEARRSQQVLLSDIRDLLHSFERLIEDTNSGDQLQQFLWGLRGQRLSLEEEITQEEAEQRRKDKQAAKQARKDERQRNKEQRNKEQRGHLKEVKDHAIVKGVETSTQAYRHLLTLARIALVQPELRHIFSDFVLLGLEVADQTISDTFGSDARRSLGQVVDPNRGTVEAIIAKAKSAHSNLSALDKEEIQREAVAAINERTQAGLSGAASAQTPNLIKLKSRLRATYELIQRKRAGEHIDVDLPTIDELRQLLQEQMEAGLTVPEELRALVKAGTEGAVNGTELSMPLPEDVAEGSVPAASQNGHLPLLRSDVADLVQLIGVDSLLDKGASFGSSISEAKLRAADASRKARKEAVKNAKEGWSEHGRQRLAARSRKLLMDIQGQESSQAAFLWFLDTFEQFLGWVASVSVDVPGNVAAKTTAAWDKLGPAMSLLDTLAGGGGQVRPILDLLRHLSIGYREDAGMHDFVVEIDQFARDCLLKEGWVLEPGCDEQARRILQRFRSMRSEYRDDLRRLLVMVRSLFSSTPENPAVRDTTAALRRLGKDLTLGKGYLYLPRPSIAREILQHLLPPLILKFGILPIPRIKYTHPDVVLTLENIAISLNQLLPNIIDFKMTNDVHIDLKQIRQTSHVHSFKLKIKGMGLRVHKVAFAVELLKGLRIHDRGILDLLVTDVGMSIYIDVPKEYSQHFFLVRKVKGKLGKLKVAVRQSNHRIIHRLAEALVDSKITKLILRNLMARGVTIGLKQLDVALMQMRLNPAQPDDRKAMVRLKQQAAELRDLMVKLREESGALEIDFLERRSDGTVGESQIGQWKEESYAYRWIKGQFQRTGRREVERDEWRSNAFDLAPEGEGPTAADIGLATMQDAEGDLKRDRHKPKPGKEESEKEAAKAGKPQGPTTQATVEDADRTLHQQKRRYWPWFHSSKKQNKGNENAPAAESKVGRQAEKGGGSPKEQVKKLEASVERTDPQRS